MNDTATQERVSGVEPYSLKDAPALIERVFPAQKISVEAQKERKANVGQTLTPLGTYWKGRKPLILCRALTLACLLPSTGDDQKDLDVLEKLLGVDDDAFPRREPKVKPIEIARTVELDRPEHLFEVLNPDGPTPARFPAMQSAFPSLRVRWRRDASDDEKAKVIRAFLANLPYEEKVERSKRPEECPETSLFESVWSDVNTHLGTSAGSLSELTKQLGIMRFGRRPKVGDVFCGGGSVPFEAARSGADVHASDLNPIGCALTWGALNVIGGNESNKQGIEKLQSDVCDAVEREVRKFGIEHDGDGNRAKVFLYCQEATCPQTGWSIPLSPTWVVSKNHRVAVKLVPNRKLKRFEFDVRSDLDAEEFAEAERGTVQGGDMVYTLDGETYRVPIKSVRGDRRDEAGRWRNALRRWKLEDVSPRENDVFRERLYCIQWASGQDLEAGKARPRTWFAAPTNEDLRREAVVEHMVSKHMSAWQRAGLIPDMQIESGVNTDQPVRERGWTCWHHMFNPRQLLLAKLVREKSMDLAGSDVEDGAMALSFCRALDASSRLCRWDNAIGQDRVANTFSNQALNTVYNYPARGFMHLRPQLQYGFWPEEGALHLHTNSEVHNGTAGELNQNADYWITDPPYADAINYHEITEFFIAWLRKNPPKPFNHWIWDSRRSKAIKGDGPEFRKGMIDAYKAMANHMPDNGLQCVMFTHQDTGVWRDMASIFWGAGLQVVSAWYIATETSSELKKGGYVQGTVIMVLRKRPEEGLDAYTDELVPEIKEEVRNQIATMTGMNQRAGEGERSENVFSDADMQMAGYAAALRVLTKYTEIDSRDMREYALETRQKGEQTEVDKLLDFAVRAANDELVPEGLSANAWSTAEPAERFYLRMLDVEAAGGHKLDNFQNFAKVFRVENYRDLMASVKPNEARMKGAADFRAKELDNSDLASTRLGLALYAIREVLRDADPETALKNLREASEDWHRDRDQIRSIVTYMDQKLDGREGREREAEACRVLKGRIDNESF